jgi:hypothetical protein
MLTVATLVIQKKNALRLLGTLTGGRIIKRGKKSGIENSQPRATLIQAETRVPSGTPSASTPGTSTSNQTNTVHGAEINMVKDLSPEKNLNCVVNCSNRSYEWIINSGATDHMTFMKEDLVNLTEPRRKEILMQMNILI